MDPMCGSGTLLLEAGLMARNLAPGLARDPATWPFTRWPDFQPQVGAVHRQGHGGGGVLGVRVEAQVGDSHGETLPMRAAPGLLAGGAAGRPQMTP